MYISKDIGKPPISDWRQSDKKLTYKSLNPYLWPVSLSKSMSLTLSFHAHFCVQVHFHVHSSWTRIWTWTWTTEHEHEPRNMNMNNGTWTRTTEHEHEPRNLNRNHGAWTMNMNMKLFERKVFFGNWVNSILDYSDIRIDLNVDIVSIPVSVWEAFSPTIFSQTS
jgi:hypothetical protein